MAVGSTVWLMLTDAQLLEICAGASEYEILHTALLSQERVRCPFRKQFKQRSCPRRSLMRFATGLFANLSHWKSGWSPSHTKQSGRLTDAWCARMYGRVSRDTTAFGLFTLVNKPEVSYARSSLDRYASNSENVGKEVTLL